MKKCVLLINFSLACFLCFGQVKVEKVNKESLSKFDLGIKSAIRNVLIPDKEKKLMELEESISSLAAEAPVPIGFATDFVQDFDSIIEECFDGNCYKELILQSEGSKSMGIVFEGFYLSENAEFYIINEQANYIQGPIKAEYVSHPEKFVSGLMPGDRLKLLLVEPVSDRSKSRVRISKISHVIVDFYGVSSAEDDCGYGFNCSAACNNNVNCFPDYQTEANGVCLLFRMSEVGNQRITYVTGSLLNNGNQDFEPIILTSGHGIPLNELNILQFAFYYRSPQCNPTTDGPMTISVQGAQTLGNTAGHTDLRLLKLDTNPYNNPVFSGNPVSFLGWSIKEEPLDEVASIHHPFADVQKISFGEDLGTYIDFTNREFWSYDWYDGITESTSSGSPFFNHNKKVIGAIHGSEPPHAGSMDCDYETNPRGLSGKLHLAWGEFKQFLDPNDEGIVETSTIVNQPGAIVKSQITGPDILCASETYTLQNPPLGGVDWEVSAPHFFTSGSGTGTTANLSLTNPAAAGTVNLTYSFPGLGTSTNQIDKEIQVGPEYPDFDFYFFPSCVSPNQVITVVANITQVDYDWTVNGGTIMSGQGSQSIDIMVGSSGYVSVHCYVSNGPLACGGPRGIVSFYPMSCFGMMENNVMVYPNPANDILHLKSETGENFSGEITLIDEQNKYRKTFQAGECDIAIDVSGFPPGVYYVSYTIGETHQVKRIRIK